MRFEDRLKLLQGKRTNKEVAAKAKISASYYSDIRRGRTIPSVRVLFWLAYALEVAPTALLTDVGYDSVPAPVEYEPVLNLREHYSAVCATCHFGRWQDGAYTCQRPDGPRYDKGWQDAPWRMTCDRHQYRRGLK